ncbi:MAG: hypothetical protein KDI90_10340 [Alphaproteobacteria bacterium]|nr:hypothetical protein [Alphaproteobacteria bacterium]MCB1682055.1 hypothetical protein [Alphaproteobacteria bacterium]MCB9975735.1 hypothetical protein [Rhodospirillales bacterium]
MNLIAKRVPKKWPHALALLAIVCSLLVHTAPLFNFKDKNGFTVSICTAYGPQTITLDKNGKEIPPERKNTARQGCPYCIASALGKVPLSTAGFIPLPAARADGSINFTYFNAPAAGRSPGSAPIRAPPAFS